MNIALTVKLPVGQASENNLGQILVACQGGSGLSSCCILGDLRDLNQIYLWYWYGANSLLKLFQNYLSQPSSEH